MRTFLNFFLANLAVADLCVGIFCVLPNLSLYISQQWLIGMAMCKLFYFVQSLNYTCSIIILTVISLERFLAINHPMTCKRFNRSRVLRCSVVACVWTASIAYSTPLLFIYSTFSLPPSPGANTDQDDVYCVRVLPSNSRLTTIYVMVDLFLFYLLPLLLMLIVYTKIAVVLWRSSAMEQHPDWTKSSIPLERCTRTSRGSLRNPSSFSRINETFTHIGQMSMTSRRRTSSLLAACPEMDSRKVSLASSGSGPRLLEVPRRTVFRTKSVSTPDLGGAESIERNGHPQDDTTGCSPDITRAPEDYIISSISSLTSSSPRLLNTSSSVCIVESRDETRSTEAGPTRMSNGAYRHPSLGGNSSFARLSVSTSQCRFSRTSGGSAEILIHAPTPGARKPPCLPGAALHPVKTRALSAIFAPAAAAARLSTTSLGGQCRSSSSRRRHPLLHRRKVIRLLIAMVIAFGVCMLPHHVRLQWQEWSDVGDYTQELMYIPPITTLLFYINSCLNPFLYALISNKFRKSLRELRHNLRAAGRRFTSDRRK